MTPRQMGLVIGVGNVVVLSFLAWVFFGADPETPAEQVARMNNEKIKKLELQVTTLQTSLTTSETKRKEAEIANEDEKARKRDRPGEEEELRVRKLKVQEAEIQVKLANFINEEEKNLVGRKHVVKIEEDNRQIRIAVEGALERHKGHELAMKLDEARVQERVYLQNDREALALEKEAFLVQRERAAEKKERNAERLTADVVRAAVGVPGRQSYAGHGMGQSAFEGRNYLLGRYAGGPSIRRR